MYHYSSDESLTEDHEFTSGENELMSDSERDIYDCILNENLDGVIMHLSNGIDIDSVDDDGFTPLMVGAVNGYYNIVEYLIQNNADINIVNDQQNEKTALMYAINEGHVDVAKYIIHQEHAEINKTNTLMQTPLIVATIDGYVDIVKCLIDHHANINVTDPWNRTALILAAERGLIEIVKHLVNNNTIKLNVANNDGETALICSSKQFRFVIENANKVRISHYDVIKYLIEHGADINITSNNGSTALSNASMNGHYRIVKYLVDNGADTNKRDDFGNTALDYAIIRHYYNIIKLLLPITCLSVKDIQKLYTWFNNVDNHIKNDLLTTMCKRDIERYLAFCALFSVGAYAEPHDENKQEENSEMIGYDSPTNENTVRPFPPMFDSNSNDSSFDANLAGEIFEFARDSLEGKLIIQDI